MNADGRPGVSVDVQVGARAGWLLPLSVGLLIAGGLLAAGAAALIGYGASGATPATAASEPVDAPPEPVTVTATLDEPLSRWLWLVKWLLLFPTT